MTPATDAGSRLTLQDYLDELLSPVASRTQASGVPAYQLYRAGNVRVAVASSQLADAEVAEGGAGWRHWLDVGRMLHGLPATVAMPTEPVLLRATPAWGLSVDANEGVVEVSDDVVTWRNPRGSRRWLAGLIETHGAVILDPVALVEEAELRGIQGAV